MVMKGVLEGLEVMHANNIMHRDLKPENLLLKSPEQDTEVKLADFGLSKVLGQEVMMQTACGTPGYVAPEILKSEAYGPAVDVWSIGVILYILLCGFPPLYDETAAGLYDQIKKGKYDFPDPYWTDISDSAKDLVKCLLCVDPKKRYTTDQVLTHPWLSGTASDRAFGSGYNKKLQQFNARRKLRQAITMVLAANKLARTIGFDLPEGDASTEGDL